MPEFPYPKKRFGQNFLTNKSYAKKIVDSLEIESQDSVIEIGPGRGILTRILIEKKCDSLFAIEIDNQLSEYLQKEYGSSIKIYNEDFLSFSFSDIFNKTNSPVKIIGNIPYNITSPIIFHILDNKEYISYAVLMVQKEVAERLVAKKDTKEYGILTVMVNSQCEVENLFSINRKNFHPSPNVDSAVIKLNLINTKNETEQNSEKFTPELNKLFKHIVQSTFNYRRKMLKNSLKMIFEDRILENIKSVPLNARPENLSIEDFKNLTFEICHIKNR